MFLKSKLNFLFSLRSSFFAHIFFLFKRCGAIAKRASFANTWLPSARLVCTFCATIKGTEREFSSVGFFVSPCDDYVVALALGGWAPVVLGRYFN